MEELIKEIAIYLYSRKKMGEKFIRKEAYELVELLRDHDHNELLAKLDDEYVKYAISQDVDRVNDLIRINWMINKLYEVYKDEKERKPIRKQFKSIGNDLFSSYYSMCSLHTKRIDMIKWRIESLITLFKEELILFTYPHDNEELTEYVDYRHAIYLYQTELPCYKLFLQFWEAYDINKAIDIGKIELIPDLQNKIRELVLR